MNKFLLLLIGITLSVVSCKDKAEKVGTEAADVVAGKSVVGKWKPVEVDIKEMSEDEKNMMKENVTLEFNKDGTYTFRNKERKQEGNYTFDQATKKLKAVPTAPDSERTEEFTINWEGDLMLMVNEEGTVKLKKQ
jgi:hypothetical protein